MHTFRNGGVGKNTLGQFMFSGFKLLCYAEALNLFSDFRANHMGAE